MPETLVVGKLMNRNHWEQVWNFWNFSENKNIDNEAERLYEVWLI
jgi:hypothetical protein